MSLIVLVTGARSGIGEATCRTLVAAGHRVIGTARDPQQLSDLAAELGDAFCPVGLDVDDPDAPAAMLEQLPADWRPVDVLVNNAGHDQGGRRY